MGHGGGGFLYGFGVIFRGHYPPKNELRQFSLTHTLDRYADTANEATGTLLTYIAN
jgi:hypothetical protein